MTVFWIAVAVMMLACLAFIMLPLSRARTQVTASEAQVSLAIHRERLRELELSHAQGITSAAALRQDRDDIARQILADAVADSAALASAPVPAADRGALLGAAFVIPTLAVVLYFWLGDVGALNEITAARAGAPAMQGAGAEHSVAQMVARLETRLQAAPEDAEGWALLGRSYGYLQQHDKSVAALTRASALDGGNTRFLADLAEALMLSNGHRIDARVQGLLDKVLAQEPEHPKARFLLGLKSSGDAPLTAPRNGAPAPPASLKVRVALSGSLRATLPAEATVFVFARPVQGPRMPLAIVRRAARELPFEVALSDAQAMSAQHRLSQHRHVIVGARVSASGNATASPGDLQGLGAPVEWARAGVTQVEIDHVVR